MARIECIHEDDVLLMVQTGRWPDRAPEELRAHAADCQVCGEMALVAGAFDEDAAVREIPQLPSAGTVWWKAQLRARQEAAQAAVRPITATQALAFAAAVGAVGAVFGATAVWFQDSLHWFGRAFSGVTTAVRLPALESASLDLASVSAGNWIILLVGGLGLVAAAFVVGWAMKEE